MANPEHLAILKQGVTEWNAWQQKKEDVKPDLGGADLILADLSAADLIGANLSGANLSGADLSSANLSGADLSSANLIGANLSSANLIGANLFEADLRRANLFAAELRGANYTIETIWPANFSPQAYGARLVEAPERGSTSTSSDLTSRSSDLTLTFDPSLSPEQIKLTLEALADYYRACGGAGFLIDFETQEVAAQEPEHVGQG